MWILISAAFIFSCEKNSQKEKQSERCILNISAGGLSTKAGNNIENDIVYLDGDLNEIPNTKLSVTYQQDSTSDDQSWYGVIRWNINDKVKLYQRESNTSSSASGLSLHNMILNVYQYRDINPVGTSPTGRAALCERVSSYPNDFTSLDYPASDTRYYFLAFPAENHTNILTRTFDYTISNPETYLTREQYMSDNLLLTSGLFFDFTSSLQYLTTTIQMHPQMAILRIQLYTHLSFNMTSMSIRARNSNGSSINYFSKILRINEPTTVGAGAPCIINTVANSNEFSLKTINFTEPVSLSTNEDQPTVIYILIHRNTNIDTSASTFTGGYFTFSFTDGTNTVTLPNKNIKDFSAGKMYNITSKWDITPNTGN